ncbi:uncharacterized protein LOC144446962 isoform X2 [Glandiceps talaboti]
MTGIKKRDPKTEITTERLDSNAENESGKTLENRRNRSVPAALSTIVGQSVDTEHAAQVERKGHMTDQDGSVDKSIIKLFSRMTVGFRSKLVSPKPKPFRGTRLTWKEKIRLNNGIWRAWHLQYIKQKDPIIGTFVEPLTAEHSTRPSWQPDILEGKFWKQKLETTVSDYRKWRMFAAAKGENYYSPMMVQIEEEEEDYNRTPHPPPSPCPASTLSTDDIPLPKRKFEDTLFTTLRREAFEFPKAREIAKKTQNADVIQPGLSQLQPDFDDFMDTLESLQGLPDALLQRQEDQQPLVHSSDSVQGLLELQGGGDMPMQVSEENGMIRYQGLVQVQESNHQSGFQNLAPSSIPSSTQQQPRPVSHHQIAHSLFPSFRNDQLSSQALQSLNISSNQDMMEEEDEDCKPLMFTAVNDGAISMEMMDELLGGSDSLSSQQNEMVTLVTQMQQTIPVTMISTQNSQMQQSKIVTLVTTEAPNVQQNSMATTQWVTGTPGQQSTSNGSIPSTPVSSYNHSAASSHHTTPASSRAGSRPHSRHPSLTNEPYQQIELRQAIDQYLTLQSQPVTVTQGFQGYQGQQMHHQQQIQPAATQQQHKPQHHHTSSPSLTPGHHTFSRQSSVSPGFSTPTSSYAASPYNTTQSSPYNTNQSSPYNTAHSSPAPSPHLSRRSSFDHGQISHSTSLEHIGAHVSGHVTPPPCMEQEQQNALMDHSQLRHSTSMEHVQYKHASKDSCTSPGSYGRKTPESPGTEYPLQSPRQKVGRSLDRSRSHPSSKATSPITEGPFKFPPTQKQEHMGNQYCKSEAKGHRKLSTQSVREWDAMAPSVPASASGQASTASSAASSPGSYQETQSPEMFEFQQPRAKRHKKTAMDEQERVERRRLKHRTSEIKRRSNIQIGLDELQSLVGLGDPEIESRVSLAVMLQKATDHIERLKKDMEKQKQDAKKYKAQIQNLKGEISDVQEQLPDSGVPVRNQSNDEALQEMLDKYIQEKSQDNWKFYPFGLIQKEFFRPYRKCLDSATEDQLESSIQIWMDKECKLSKMRSAVTTALTTVSVKTDLLEDPSKLPEQAKQAASRLLQERREERKQSQSDNPS